MQSLLDYLAFRGPDGRECWVDGSIGLGHAMLRTTRESVGEHQPASIDGRFWIVADARIDSRAELIAELQRAGRAVRQNVPDSELILHAYAAWGTSCVERLRGDFSFGIWDTRHEQLFCARDHFGIRPFYYAQLGELFFFSNTLNCIRLHPRVSDELNEAAIGDFLLFGLNYDNGTTSFRDVQRLPPAHSLSISSGGVKIRRYWKPPTDGRIRYSKPEEYIENFHTLLQAAVADRLRAERVGILLSGGLDSSAIAAVAKEASARSAGKTEIRSYTEVYESLVPHDDGEYARETAAYLGIPHRVIPMDQAQIFERWDHPAAGWPEPIGNPLVASIFDSYGIVAEECRVALSGEGGDNLLHFEIWPHLKVLRRNRDFRRLLSETANYLWIRPFPWRGIRARLLRLTGRDPTRREFPKWLALDFSRRLNLAERWKDYGEHPPLVFVHPIHPRAHASLSLPQWTLMFEQENAGVMHHAVEIRYPFLDLRIVEYLLGLPPFPWFFQKMLLRESMAGRLPERVRTRRKTPMQGDPIAAQFRKTGGELPKQMRWDTNVDQYINRSEMVVPHGNMDTEQLSSALRPYCLNYWLKSAGRIRHETVAETGNGKAR